MRIFRHGLIAGVLGYATIAGFYALLNALSGRPLWSTAAALGQAILGQAGEVDIATFDPRPVLLFNGIHLATFLVIGWISAWLVSEADRHPVLWYLLFCLGIFVFSHLWAIAYAVALPVTDVVPGWSVLVAGLAAAAVMGLYLWVSDPQLRTGVTSGDLEDM